MPPEVGPDADAVFGELLRAGESDARLGAALAACALDGPAMISLLRRAVRDAVLAAEKQERIAKAGIEIAGKMGIPGVKYALDVNGYYGGRPRMPLLPLTGDEQRVVDELMTDIRN